MSTTALQKPPITLQQWIDIAGRFTRHDPQLQREMQKFDTSNLVTVLEERYGRDFGQRQMVKTGEHENFQRKILGREPTYLEVEDSAHGVVSGTSSVQFERGRAQAEAARIDTQTGSGTQPSGGAGAGSSDALRSLRAVKAMAGGFQAGLAATTGGGRPMKEFRQQLITWLQSVINEATRGGATD